MARRNDASQDGAGRAVALAIPLLAVSMAIAFAWPLIKLDGPHALLTVLSNDRTEYAPGYTHRRFAKIEPGMTRAEVTALLGEPLNKNESSGAGYWSYSRTLRAPRTWSRNVVFRGEVVVAVPSDYEE